MVPAQNRKRAEKLEISKIPDFSDFLDFTKRLEFSDFTPNGPPKSTINLGLQQHFGPGSEKVGNFENS